MLPDHNGPMAEACNKNLALFLAHLRSEEEFDKENLYAMATVVDDLRYQKPPAEPYSMQEYKLKLSNERFDAAAYLRDHKEIGVWSEKMSAVTWENVCNAGWLERLIEYMRAQGDNSTAAKCWHVYDGYPITMYSGNKIVWERKQIK